MELFVGEKLDWWFLLRNADFHVQSKVLLHAVNLQHGADGFTSPLKEGVLRIFLPLKIQRLWLGLNPWTWVGQHATPRPLKPLLYGLKAQGNEHPVTRCNIPGEKSWTAPLQSLKTYKKKFLSSVFIQNKMYYTSDISDLCSKKLPFTTINNQLEIHQHTKGQSPTVKVFKNTEPEIIFLCTEKSSSWKMEE